MVTVLSSPSLRHRRLKRFTTAVERNTMGEKRIIKSSRGQAARRVMASLRRLPRILGVISPKMRISTVITTVTTAEAASSVSRPWAVAARFTASTVAMEVAAMFTRLLPMSTVARAWS